MFMKKKHAKPHPKAKKKHRKVTHKEISLSAIAKKHEDERTVIVFERLILNLFQERCITAMEKELITISTRAKKITKDISCKHYLDTSILIDSASTVIEVCRDIIENTKILFDEELKKRDELVKL